MCEWDKGPAKGMPEAIDFGPLRTDEVRALLLFCNGVANHDEKLLVRRLYGRLDAVYLWHENEARKAQKEAQHAH